MSILVGECLDFRCGLSVICEFFSGGLGLVFFQLSLKSEASSSQRYQGRVRYLNSHLIIATFITFGGILVSARVRRGPFAA